METKVIRRNHREPEIKLTFCNDNYYAMRERAAEKARRKIQIKIHTLRVIGTALMGFGVFCGGASVNDPTHWYMGSIVALPLVLTGLVTLSKAKKQ